MKNIFLSMLLCVLSISVISASSKVIRIGGSSTVTPIASKAADKFRLYESDLRIFVSPTGSGAGIRAVGSGSVDIGMVSRKIDPREREFFKDIDFHLTTVGKDAVTPVVSKAIYQYGITALSLEDLRKIYSGEITNWKYFGGPDSEILVIDKEASRGTRHVFMQAIFGNENASAPGARLVTGSNNEEQTAVTQSNVAIGMLSNAWMNDRVRGLAIIINGKPIQPTVENVSKGHYPISRDLYLLTNGKPEGPAKKFISFVLSPIGQDIVEELGYVAVGETTRKFN